MGFNLQNEAYFESLINDVIKSSAIEGEHLDSQEVRSSIARKLGIDTGGLVEASKDVEGMVEVMMDAC